MDDDDETAVAEPATITAATEHADETVVLADAPQTRVIADGVAFETRPLAWSVEDTAPDVNDAPAERYSWSATWLNVAVLLLGAVVVAGAIGFGGWRWFHEHRETRPASPQGAPAAAPASPPPLLDGTYKLTFYPAREVFHGKTPPNAPPDNTPFSIWWGIRSACPPAGCVAAATNLDDNDHQAAAANHRQWVFDFLDGAWQQATAETRTVPCLDNTAETTWTSMSMTPRPDGTLDGLETSTITTDDCGMLGNTVETPFTAERVGEAPEVAVSPPASPVAMTPVPKVPKLPEQKVDPQDEQFIAQLADHGIPASAFPRGAESEVVDGHVTCDVKHHGFPMDQQAAVMRQTPDGKGLTQEQAEWFVKLAVSAYCP